MWGTITIYVNYDPRISYQIKTVKSRIERSIVITTLHVYIHTIIIIENNIYNVSQLRILSEKNESYIASCNSS